jgi:hypothetical protein
LTTTVDGAMPVATPTEQATLRLDGTTDPKQESDPDQIPEPRLRETLRSVPTRPDFKAFHPVFLSRIWLQGQKANRLVETRVTGETSLHRNAPYVSLPAIYSKSSSIKKHFS